MVMVMVMVLSLGTLWGTQGAPMHLCLVTLPSGMGIPLGQSVRIALWGIHRGVSGHESMPLRRPSVLMRSIPYPPLG